jgi:hypothetical protein
VSAATHHRSYPRRTHRPVRVWFPLSVLVWLILMPLAVVATPFVFVAALVWRLNPFTAIGALFGLLIALCGVRIEVDTPGARVNLF